MKDSKTNVYILKTQRMRNATAYTTCNCLHNSATRCKRPLHKPGKNGYGSYENHVVVEPESVLAVPGDHESQIRLRVENSDFCFPIVVVGLAEVCRNGVKWAAHGAAR